MGDCVSAMEKVCEADDLALTFTDHDLQEGEQAPAAFLSVNKDRIITALRKLKRPESRLVKR